MPDRAWMTTCGMGPAVQKTMEIPWETGKAAATAGYDMSGKGLTQVGDAMVVVPGMDKVVDGTKSGMTFVTDGTTKMYDTTLEQTKSLTDPMMEQALTATDMVVDQTMNGTKIMTDQVKNGYDQTADITGKGLSSVGDGIAVIPGGDKLVDGTKGSISFVQDGTKTATGAVMDTTKASTTFVVDGAKAGMTQGMDGMTTVASTTYDMSGKGLSQVGDGVAMIPGGDQVVTYTKDYTLDPLNKYTVDPMVDVVKTTQTGFVDVAAVSMTNVTSTVDSVGGVAGFQSLMGGMFGANIDKSDAGLEAMFKTMDADGSGKVSEAEMKEAIMKVYGEALDEAVLKTMMTSADTNNDGEVDLDEFKTIMRAGPDSK